MLPSNRVRELQDEKGVIRSHDLTTHNFLQ